MQSYDAKCARCSLRILTPPVFGDWQQRLRYDLRKTAYGGSCGKSQTGSGHLISPGNLTSGSPKVSDRKPANCAAARPFNCRRSLFSACISQRSTPQSYLYCRHFPVGLENQNYISHKSGNYTGRPAVVSRGAGWRWSVWGLGNGVYMDHHR